MRSAAAFLALAAAPALADVVHLTNGGRLVGRVEDDGDRVRVVMAGGTMTVAKSRIESVERQETPPEELARRRRELAKGDAAAAVALAQFADDAGFAAEEGELLELAASWAPDDATIRRRLVLWRVFDRPLPVDAAAETALAASVGAGVGVYRTAHWRIACETDLAGARRRGEMLEAAWRKFRGFVERTGLKVRPVADRMDCVVYRDHADWLKATGLPAADVQGLVGIYHGATGRILLYDARTSPAAKETDRVVAEELAALGEARALVEKQRGQVAEIEKALADGLAAKTRDEKHLDELRGWLAAAGKAIEKNEDELTAREDDLARFRADAGRHYAEENVAASTHEACHQIAFALGVSHAGQPSWLVEGLATLFEPQSRTTFVLEAPNAPRLKDARASWAAGEGGDLRRIVTDAVFERKTLGAQAYADAWTLTYFLANRRSAQFARFLADGASLPGGAPSAAARLTDFQCFFGADLDALEREWRDYVEHL